MALLLCALSSPLRAESAFRGLYDLDRLPLLDANHRTAQISGGPQASVRPGQGARRDNDEWTLADLNGPGVVRRIWSSDPSGRLRVYLDGEAEPAVDVPFADIFQDRVPGFHSPIAGKSSGGWYSYVPIPFRQSCRITVAGANPFPYQVTWRETGSDAGLPAFDRVLDGEEQAEYEAALRAWRNPGAPDWDEQDIVLPARSFALPPNGKWAQPVQGPGTITALRFRFGRGTRFEDLRRAILRITFDDGAPAVETPLGDFFGVGFDDVAWRSLALGYDEDGAYCLFRMPFRKSARIEVENQGKRDLVATFTGKARSGVPDAPWGYFRASYRTAINKPGRPYVAAQLRGMGQVVGLTQAMRGNGTLAFLDGGFTVRVDGESAPRIHSVPAASYFNAGRRFSDGPVDVATHGCSRKTESEIGAWRLHVPDPIPFARSLDFTVAHGAGNDAPGTEYSSVVYWYGAAGAKDAAPALPQGSHLMPRPYVASVEGAIEAESVNWTLSKGAVAKPQAWEAISPFRGGGRLLFKGKPGDVASSTLHFPFADLYDVEVYLSGAGTNSTARILMDGQAVGDVVRDAASPVPIRKVAVGSVRLTEGRHTFGVRISAGGSIGLDSFRILPRTPLIRDYAVLGPFPADPEAGLQTALDPDGKAPALDRAYPAGEEAVHWRILQTSHGVLDLAPHITPRENTVAYAAFAVKSPSARNMALMLGADGGVAVWVNGEKVHTSERERRLKLDEDRIAIRLKAGWNTVLLKVRGSDGLWRVAARIPDPEQTLTFAALPGDS